MKDEYTALELVDNNTAHRFEMYVGPELAQIVYRRTGDVVNLLHTEVTPALEGKGAATAIIEKTLAYLEQNKLQLIPSCPLVAAYVKRHPEWERIVVMR